MLNHRTLGRELSNWGRWGSDDQLGTLNLLTSDRVLAGARSIRSGQVLELSLPLDEHGPQPVGSRRGNPVHMMTRLPDAPVEEGGFHFFDDAMFLHLQGATQLDALAHVSYDGLLYNGVSSVSAVTSAGASRLGMENYVGRITGRAVLLDIPALTGRDRLDSVEPVSAEDLSAAEARAGVRVAPGDIVVVRTGWMQVLLGGDAEAYFATEPGLDLSTARWLHERDVAFVASDNWGVEVAPSESGAAMPLHCVLVRDMGMPLGEMFVLEELAAVSASQERADFHISCAGLRVTGGVGSPASPVATF
ncbi:cyclase [Microbacterium sp. CH12i]|uniref:cyclase family protein n=1 Tax=Microbacterium sp. CH12i TaxID=1479651 RepID=UPI0004614D81|nr:cyclase family protein [Microbacterium sp. CH12i]KDA04722.1 cyclase [Microbacterium sp. CH12i]